MFGTTEYWAYHLTNTLAFALIVVLVWRVLKRCGASDSAANIAMLLFIVLPWFTPAVVWIAARDYLGMTLFALATWLALLHYCQRRRWRDLLPVGLCYALALGFKEASVAVVALAGLYLLMVDGKRWRCLARDAVLMGSLVSITLGYLTPLCV